MPSAFAFNDHGRVLPTAAKHKTRYRRIERSDDGDLVTAHSRVNQLGAFTCTSHIVSTAPRPGKVLACALVLLDTLMSAHKHSRAELNYGCSVDSPRA